MLRFLHEIEDLNEYQLRKKVSQKIQKLERKSLKFCPTDTEIGYQVGYKPQFKGFSSEPEEDVSFVLNCIYGQFARKDTKMIYGLAWDLDKGTGVNDGDYYYLDDQEYLYSFCEYIQDKEIEDEYELFGYIKDFLKDYFGCIKKIGREAMHQLILKKEDECFDPIHEHSIRDFKGKGNAMCSEYAVMAHNILKLFDFESYLIVGTVILNDDVPEAHAYNLITFQESDTDEVKHAVLDFINGVEVFDVDFQKVGEEPFIGFIDELDQAFIDRLVHEEAHLKFEDYRFVIMQSMVLKVGIQNKMRDYYIDDYLYANANVKSNKIYTKEKETCAIINE